MAEEQRRKFVRKDYPQTSNDVSLLEGNVPPQALEVEEAVLGALMLESDAINTAQEYITENMFYKEEHRIIYSVINELSQDNKAVDLFTVLEALKKSDSLDKVGGISFLTHLTQLVGSAANIESYARIVAQKFVQRELITTAVEIQKRAYDTESDVNDLIGFAESEILKVTEGHVKKTVLSSSDILRKAFAQIETAAKNTSKYSGVCTGFKAVDDVTLGWQPSDLIIIAARPSMGKTAFVLSMARNMAVDYEAAVAFFSLEMSSVQLMTRLIVAETGISSDIIRSGKLSPEQWSHMEVATKPLAKAPLFIDDTAGLSIFEFRSKVRRLKAVNDIKIIIIDYLQLMTSGQKSDKGNREQEVAFISRTLKAVAKELEVPIIALSQLNRSTESRGGSKRPQLSDLRESGAIEQDADIVAFIHRPEYYGFKDVDGHSTVGLAEIIIAKHRNGAVGDVNLRFIKEQALFTDMEYSEQFGAPEEEQYETFDSSANISNNVLPPVNGADEFLPGGGNPPMGSPF